MLDILVQERRGQAAEQFLRRVLQSCEYEPRVVITDKLASHAPGVSRVLPRTEHRRHKRLSNRAEKSYLPTNERESGCSSVSSHPSTRSASSVRSAPCATTSAHADTAPPPPPIDRSAPSATRRLAGRHSERSAAIRPSNVTGLAHFDAPVATLIP